MLSSRFLANSDFAQLYADATLELTDSLFSDGTAGDIVADWVEMLADQNIVDAATVQANADAIVAAFPAG